MFKALRVRELVLNQHNKAVFICKTLFESLLFKFWKIKVLYVLLIGIKEAFKNISYLPLVKSSKKIVSTLCNEQSKKKNIELKNIRSSVFFSKKKYILKKKLVGIKLESALYSLIGTPYSVDLNNIGVIRFFRGSGFIKQAMSDFSFRNVKKILVKKNLGKSGKKQLKVHKLLNILATSSLYFNGAPLVGYLGGALRLAGKNHFVILRTFTEVLDIFFFSKLARSLSGVQLRLNGKLNGRMRRSKYHYKLGEVQLQKLQQMLTYHSGFSYTKFGVISIKLWLMKKL